MPSHFGPNLILLEKLAAGGMGEVYRAKQMGGGGFEKTVAVKRILPHFAAVKEFEEMFRREMNLCAALQHPNIAQVFSNGLEAGYLFLVMEFINGKNVAELLSRTKVSSKRIPFEIACYIIAEAAKGLDYAHSLKNEDTGESLHLVHRDISPQNIMMSYNGEIKLVDFGIAKAADSADHTRTGDLKGKIPYVSPEYIAGEKPDGRSDIFSLGIVFYQMFSLESLFGGETPFETMKNIREKVILPLTTFDPDFPPALTRIILKALERDRSKRYQTAGELYRDLVQFSNQAFPKFVSTDLSTYLKEVFKDKIESEAKVRKAMSELPVENVVTSAGEPHRVTSDPAVHTMKAKTPFVSSRATGAPQTPEPSPFDHLAQFTVTISRRKSFRYLILVVAILASIYPVRRYLASRDILDPVLVPGLVARYEGDSLIKETGEKTWTWADSTANKFDATQTKGFGQPFVIKDGLNGHVVLRFDGISTFLTADAVAEKMRSSKGLSLFYVVKALGFKSHFAWSFHATHQNTDIVRGGFTSASRIRLKSNRLEGTAYDDSEPMEVEKFAVYSTVFGETKERAFQNGQLKLEKSLATPIDYSDATFFSIGQEWDEDGPSDFFTGDIAEIIIYMGEVSDSARVQVENYLGYKYDIRIKH